MSEHPSAQAARAWVADDPDPASRAAVEAWLADGDLAALEAAFGEPLTFGTSGIRGPLGPGAARMNRRLARLVAASLAREVGGGRVVLGRDARNGSDELARDAAAVLAGAGVRTLVLAEPVPTPVLAHAVRALGCDGGVMVTASHNPPGDNGLKLYAADGAPRAAPLALAGLVRDLPLGEPEVLGDEVRRAYLEAAAERLPSGPSDVRAVYTALHGVAGRCVLDLFVAVGLPAPLVVEAQFAPDAEFPTVAFPNPEEPGALDLALSLARSSGADVVLATDPDGDRLGVAVPDGEGWRTLTGDELGVLLAEQALATSAGGDRLVATSFMSSGLLGRLAAEHGVQCAETEPGFKWIARAGAGRPGTRLVFAYEEALGYAVCDHVKDKDGITAAVAFARLVARLKAEGTTVVDRLAAIAARHGLHASRQWAVRADAARIRAAVDRLLASPPARLGGRAVVGVEQPAPRVVVLRLAGDARVLVRPSGTEPKLKRYFNVVAPAGTSEAVALAQLEALRDDLDAVLDL